MSSTRILPLLAAALMLAGCGQSKTSDFYILQSSAAPLVAESLPRTTLAIPEATIPAYLDTKAVILKDAQGNTLDVPRFNQWGEPLEYGVSRVLRQQLTHPLLEQGITVLPSQDAHIASRYSLIIDIVRMEADEAGTVVLESRWTLVDSPASRVMGRGSFAGKETVSLPATIGRETFQTVVAAESRLLQKFGSHIAERLTGLMQQAD